MWFGPNLQRSYKYMMFASKMPSLRMDQSDLKCKNGCDYYGNPQWQGYCSKCHRELMQKQRRAEKATLTSATLPKPEQRKPKPGPGLMPSSSFSRFEAKKQKQSESLKKTNLMKFGSVFGKRTSDDHEIQTEKRSKFKIPTQVFEGMKADFRIRFSRLNPQIDRDARAFVHKFIGDVIEKSNELTVDELSERVQTLYQKFMKYMDTTPYFANVDSDTKERLMDFVEKHAMTYLHELPSVVFSPAGTEDERLDRAMSERIQQLGWVCEARLDCRLDRASPRCRQLLYRAATELLGMDSALSPGGKLSRARRGCRLLLALAPPPASADDLLPALIFTVLKANPPRLVSNINFVTRFCNAQRLMTGEGGYYFTNLCCAVSFIENLNAESLNMDKKEFDCYMAMPASIGGSAWAVALSLCGAAREAEEQTELIQKLMTEADQLNERAEQFAANALSFEEQIKKKVQDVLSKTPLEIKPRRELPRVGKLRQISTAPLIDLGSSVESPAPPADRQTRVAEPPKIQQESPDTSEEKEPKLNILGFEVIERDSPSKSPQNVDPTWDLKQTNSLELLTPSPLGFTPFDSRSIDELMTPDDFVSDHLAPGLSNINYDIDLSDLSAENSLAEDTPKKSKDPFSPDGLKKTFDPFAPQTSKDYKVLEKFDEFSFVDSTSRPSDPFEVVHRDPFSPVDLNSQNDPFTPQRNQTKVAQNDPFTPLRNETKIVNDPFAPQINQSQVQNDPFSAQRNENVIQNDMFTPQRSETQVNEIDPFSPRNESSILDDSESPTAACLLPSPLQPQNSGKSA